MVFFCTARPIKRKSNNKDVNKSPLKESRIDITEDLTDSMDDHLAQDSDDDFRPDDSLQKTDTKSTPEAVDISELICLFHLNIQYH